MSDDLRLLERAGAYDPVALAEIYDQYYNRIYTYIYHRLGDAGLSEDLTAEVFLRMLESVKASRAWHTSLTGWLYRIAHNLVIDHYRRQAKREGPELNERIIPAADNPVLSFEKLLSEQQLREAIHTLTDDQQQVIFLKFVDDLSNAEVADILGKTEGAIKALQHRALASLRRALEGAG